MSFIFSTVCIACIATLIQFTEGTTNSGQRYLPEDVTHMTLYGAGAVYRPELCPNEIAFMGRATQSPSLANGRLGLLPSDIMANGAVCSADVKILDIFPIGNISEYNNNTIPPQWIFEDFTLQDKPVNFTCGDFSFSIMYGYFNDVKTHDGNLDPNVVYFDFAVYPYTKPFAFCSYSNRMKDDGWLPIHRAPFPLPSVWNRVRKITLQKAVDLPQQQDKEDDDQPMQSPMYNDSNGEEEEEENEDAQDVERTTSAVKLPSSAVLRQFFSSMST